LGGVLHPIGISAAGIAHTQTREFIRDLPAFGNLGNEYILPKLSRYYVK
jgi:hypothetical protein